MRLSQSVGCSTLLKRLNCQPIKPGRLVWYYDGAQYSAYSVDVDNMLAVQKHSAASGRAYTLFIAGSRPAAAILITKTGLAYSLDPRTSRGQLLKALTRAQLYLPEPSSACAGV